MPDIRLTEEADTGRCQCWWPEALQCPNRATWRVLQLTDAGSWLMCDAHKEGFATDFPWARVRYTRVDEETSL